MLRRDVGGGVRHSFSRRNVKPIIVTRVAAPHSPTPATSNGPSSGQGPSSPWPGPGSTLYTPATQLSSQTVSPLSSMSEPEPSCTATLLLSCPDQKGVIAAVAQLLFGFGCNVVSTHNRGVSRVTSWHGLIRRNPSICQISSDQFSEFDTNMFFQRVVFDFSECIVGTGNTG